MMRRRPPGLRAEPGSRRTTPTAAVTRSSSPPDWPGWTLTALSRPAPQPQPRVQVQVQEQAQARRRPGSRPTGHAVPGGGFGGWLALCGRGFTGGSLDPDG